MGDWKFAAYRGVTAAVLAVTMFVVMMSQGHDGFFVDAESHLSVRGQVVDSMTAAYGVITMVLLLVGLSAMAVTAYMRQGVWFYISSYLMDGALFFTLAPAAGLTDVYELVAGVVSLAVMGLVLGSVVAREDASTRPERHVLFALTATVLGMIPWVLILANVIELGHALQADGEENDLHVWVLTFVSIASFAAVQVLGAFFVHSHFTKSQGGDSIGKAATDAEIRAVRWNKLIVAGVMALVALSFGLGIGLTDVYDNNCWLPLYWTIGGQVEKAWAWPALFVVPVAVASLCAVTGAHFVAMGSDAVNRVTNTGYDQWHAFTFTAVSGLVVILECEVAGVQSLTESLLLASYTMAAVMLQTMDRGPSDFPGVLRIVPALGPIVPQVMIVLKMVMSSDGDLDRSVATGVYFFVFLIFAFYALCSVSFVMMPPHKDVTVRRAMRDSAMLVTITVLLFSQAFITDSNLGDSEAHANHLISLRTPMA